MGGIEQLSATGYRCIEMSPGSNFYAVPGLSVVLANTLLEFPSGMHAHADYEFVMPQTEDVPSRCEQGEVLMLRKQLMPFNSNQSHGLSCPRTIDKLLAINCERIMLQQLSLEVFGKSDVVFKNVSFAVGPVFNFLLGRFVDEAIRRPAGYQSVQQQLARLLLIEIIRQSENNVNQMTTVNEEQQRIHRAADFLAEQYAAPFSTAAAAAVAGLSASHFVRSFNAEMGQTPYAFLLTVRIDRAMQKLSDRRLSITDVALACGFSSPGQFATVFRRKTGQSPSEYRRTLL